MGVDFKNNGIVEINFKLDSNFCDSLVDAKVLTPSNKEIIYPAFWKGDDNWAVRFMPDELGDYRVYIDNLDEILVTIKKVVKPHNILRVDKNSLIDSNNKAFFWLSDTWWMALSGRLKFEDFKYLADIRKDMGFNVIQLVVGLFPDMDSFDKRGENEGGYVWSNNFESINPKFFEVAEKKIEYLYNKGFHIALVGAWGYYLEKIGIDKMKLHWRYIIARWGVYSSIWIAAGEAIMPFYLSKNRLLESKRLRSGWQELLTYIKKIDPYKKILTIHPINNALDEINKKELLDINLLQASHQSYISIQKAIELLDNSKDIVTIMDEINYEGILRDNYDGVIRLSFWKSILKGSKGFGYGANGIWQVNYKDVVFGPSPNGANWGNIAWDEALKFKGAKDIAKSKEFLEEFEWWKLKEVNILSPKVDKNDPKAPIVASIENKIFLSYFYNPIAPWDDKYKFKLEPNSVYSYYFYSPNSYNKSLDKEFTTNSSGYWEMEIPPSLDDWILVIKQKATKNIANSFISRLKRLL